MENAQRYPAESCRLELGEVGSFSYLRTTTTTSGSVTRFLTGLRQAAKTKCMPSEFWVQIPELGCVGVVMPSSVNISFSTYKMGC